MSRIRMTLERRLIRIEMLLDSYSQEKIKDERKVDVEEEGTDSVKALGV